MSPKNTELVPVLRSLKDNLRKFMSNDVVQSVVREDDELAEIVEKARSLHNLAEITARKIDPNWIED
jgi:hypothetical protein